jgi:hypothetical protein
MRDDEDEQERTASLMTPAKLAQLRMKPVKPAASPAALLDQLAADAGAAHVRRLTELRAQLEAKARERGYATFSAALQALADALPRLDFPLLQPKGLLARMTGKGKEEALGFVAQYEAIGRAIEDVHDEFKALEKKSQAITAGLDKLLLEFDVEVRAVERIMNQGTRWLQDMRGKLGERTSAGPDAEARRLIDEDTARCELLVARLKQLRAASTGAQQVQERIKSVEDKRNSTLALLRQALDGEMRAWQVALRPVATAAEDTGSATHGVALAKNAHAELQACVKQALKDCAHLHNNELAVLDELTALVEPLQAAA